MNQKGFTLIELMLVMAISGVLLSGLVVSIYRVSWGTIHTNADNVALSEINNAALWLKKDAQMSQTTNLTDGAPAETTLELYWTDYTGWATDETRNHSSTYSLSGTELLRTHDGTVSVVGSNFTNIGFTRDVGVITCTITYSSPVISQQTMTLTFDVQMRSGG
ncbi:type II secretion system protein [Chloroflexota bacterium]